MNVFAEEKLNKKSKPLVSWLLCVNQYGNLLDRAILSCLAQTLTEFELLIVVNGSKAEILANRLEENYGSDPRVRVLKTSINLLNFSLNYGLHMAEAPYVARMDDDDVSSPNRLQLQLAFMEQHPSVAVLGSSYELIDQFGKVHGKISTPGSDEEIRRSVRFRNPICHPSVMLRKEAVIEMGGYLGGQNAEDYDLWSRLAMNPSWMFANLPHVLLSYNCDFTGGARRSRRAYSNVAAAQLRNFLITHDLRWLAGALISSAKSIFRANKL